MCSFTLRNFVIYPSLTTYQNTLKLSCLLIMAHRVLFRTTFISSSVYHHFLLKQKLPNVLDGVSGIFAPKIIIERWQIAELQQENFDRLDRCMVIFIGKFAMLNELKKMEQKMKVSKAVIKTSKKSRQTTHADQGFYKQLILSFLAVLVRFFLLPNFLKSFYRQ